MKENKINILTTRPLAQPLVEYAVEQGVAIDVKSFIDTKLNINEPTARRIKQLASKEATVVFTSMNAAEAVIRSLEVLGADPEWIIYTLGGVTSTIIEQYFTASEIFSEAINATQLAENIILNEEEEVFFFCGKQRRDELPVMLQEKHIKVEELVVYETIETPVKVKKTYDGILFFSPSAVKSFFSVNTVGESAILFAIGATTAAALRKQSGNKILVSDHPNKEYLAKMAIDHLRKTAS
ncbi:uroporphyrinogen-III synthase [Aridibaculum aurantiacum]|uniref:uroporphyrinogen-III synthase n=1 Tax=Aridibaculum aurantiacum TaxID=2810307 RepID=UPI001A97B48F|nr:uroporphyrinogen-III synthase [Aridibaculum aurantiacum]